MPVKKCEISVETLSRNVLLNERMSKNKVNGRRLMTCLFFLFCCSLISTPRLSNWWFDIADPTISQVKLSMHLQGSLMLDTNSLGVGVMKL